MWSGNTLIQLNARTGTASLVPGLSLVSTMVPDNNGTFIIDCRISLLCYWYFMDLTFKIYLRAHVQRNARALSRIA